MSLPQNVQSLYVQRACRRSGVLGEIVNTARINLFQISHGDILARAHARFMTNIGANACTVQLRILPDAAVVAPAAAAQQALSAASGNLTGLLASQMLEPTGALGVAIAIEAATPGVGIVYQPTNWWVLTPGVVNMLVGGATSAVLQLDWFLSYIPLAEDSIVKAL